MSMNLKKLFSAGSDAESPRWKTIARSLWEIMRHNWGLKLLALVMAIVLWAGLISQDANQTRQKTMEDTEIEVRGLDALKDRYIVIDGLTAGGKVPFGVAVSADIPQLKHMHASGADFHPYIDLAALDLSDLDEGGAREYQVEIRSGAEGDDLGKVNQVTPDHVTLKLEKYVSPDENRRFRVNVVTTGEAPEGWYISDPTADVAQVCVAGPLSLVDRVDRVVVRLDLGGVERTEGHRDDDRESIRLLDEAGEEIVSDQLSTHLTDPGHVRADTVYLSYDVYPTRQLSVSEAYVVEGEPAFGYRIDGVTLSTKTVTVAAPAEVLEGLSGEITIEPIRIGNYRTQNYSLNKRVQSPDDRIVNISPDQIQVSVSIVPKEEDGF